MSGEFVRAFIDFDSDDHSCFREKFQKWRAVIRRLANGFITKDHAANELMEAGCRHKEFAIGAASLERLGHSDRSKSLVAGRQALIDGEQSFVVCKECFGYFSKCWILDHGEFWETARPKSSCPSRAVDRGAMFPHLRNSFLVPGFGRSPGTKWGTAFDFRQGNTRPTRNGRKNGDLSPIGLTAPNHLWTLRTSPLGKGFHSSSCH